MEEMWRIAIVAAAAVQLSFTKQKCKKKRHKNLIAKRRCKKRAE